MAHIIIPIRRYELEMLVGVDAKGCLMKFIDKRGKNVKSAIVRLDSHIASLMATSITQCLRGGDEYLNFEFESENRKIRGQFQEVENTELGRFKRGLFIVESGKDFHVYILVFRDEELAKLKNFLVNTYDL